MRTDDPAAVAADLTCCRDEKRKDRRRRAFAVRSEFGRYAPLEQRFPAVNVVITIGEAL